MLLLGLYSFRSVLILEAVSYSIRPVEKLWNVLFFGGKPVPHKPQPWQKSCLEAILQPADKFLLHCLVKGCAAARNCSASAKRLMCPNTRMWISWTIASDHSLQ